MNSRHRRMAMLLAVPGVAACVYAIGAFLLDFLHNRLPWDPAVPHRAQYLALGQAFSRGFVAGFFLCFFLMLFAGAVGAWLVQRRQQSAAARASR